MTTRKNTSTTRSDIVRFSVGVAEIEAATAAREKGEGAAKAFKSFYDTVIKAHDVSLDGLLKKAAERSNEEAAAHDFTMQVYWTWRFGQDIATKIYDRNVAGDTVLPISQFLTDTGLPYKDQAKRQITQSYGSGSSYFKKDFVGRMIAIRDAGGAEVKRGAAAKSSDAKYVADRINAVIGRLRRDAEKFDGSVPVDVAPKLGKALLDICAAFKIDLNVK